MCIIIWFLTSDMFLFLMNLKWKEQNEPNTNIQKHAMKEMSFMNLYIFS
jgi:ABC-type uncharacterized transport system permease subunit